jgi:Cu/Ag efflux protein CusF
MRENQKNASPAEANREGTSMRTVTRILHAAVIAAGLALSAGAAQASEDEGRIAQVDVEAATITLENGNTYKLPGEFDAESLDVGMEVVLAYDTVGGENLVTDIITYE